MMRRPEEDYDVVVQQFRQRDGQDVWTVWLGGEKQGERDTRADAIELARDVAAIYSRSAWLLDETGYPLKPIEGRALH